MWIQLVFVVLHALVVGVAGCGTRPDAGARLQLVVATPPEALDPRFATSATAFRLSQLVVAPLCRIGADLTPEPLVAERIERRDARTWDVTLRAGLAFTDGSPVHADDVVYTFRSMLEPAFASPHRSRLDVIARVTALDARTVRFALTRPHAPFVVELLCAFGPISARACGTGPACRQAPVGVGAFAVSHPLDDHERIALRAVDDAAGVFGPPHARHSDVDVRVVRDGAARVLDMLSGRGDLVVGDTNAWDAQALATLTGDDVEAPHVLRARGLGVGYLAMHARGPAAGTNEAPSHAHMALRDVRVRQAIAKALDVDGVLQHRQRGGGERASGLLPAGHWAKDRGLQPIARDLDGARALLDAAGLLPDADGVRLRFTLLSTPDHARAAAAEALARSLADVGIVVDVRLRDWGALYDDVQRGAFDAFVAKWTPVVEPDLLRWVFHGDNIPAPGRAGGNRSGLVDATLDAWLDAARSTDDAAARAALYSLVERRAQQLVPLVPLWFEDEFAIVSPRVQGFSLPRTAALWALSTTTLREAAR